MRTDRLVWLVTRAAVALMAVASTSTLVAQDRSSNQTTLTNRIKALLAESGRTRLVAPLPGSRSAVVSVDTSSDLYFYLERGSIRGDSIDTFYAALESGDPQVAYDTFIGNAIIILRATDYGWNGLGIPMRSGSGRDAQDIPDVLFKDVGGSFGRAATITAEDVSTYVELLTTVISILETGS